MTNRIGFLVTLVVSLTLCGLFGFVPDAAAGIPSSGGQENRDGIEISWNAQNGTGALEGFAFLDLFASSSVRCITAPSLYFHANPLDSSEVEGRLTMYWQLDALPITQHFVSVLNLDLVPDGTYQHIVSMNGDATEGINQGHLSLQLMPFTILDSNFAYIVGNDGVTAKMVLEFNGSFGDDLDADMRGARFVPAPGNLAVFMTCLLTALRRRRDGVAPGGMKTLEAL